MSDDIKAETSATTQTCVFVKHNESREKCPDLRESCPEWEKLPYPACVEVFRHLSDVDRVTMAQVCCKFNNVFRDPSLWRKRKFIIDKKSDKRHIHFTSVLGECLQDVMLDIWHSRHYSRKNIFETFKILMENMTNARLCRFDLKDLALDRFRKYPEQRDTIISYLNKMLQTQTDLEALKLSSCHFNKITGSEVMDNMSTNLGHRLKYLGLHDFLHTVRNIYDLEKFKDTLKKFSNLTYISVNYSYISDEVLRHWAVSLHHKLKSMKISASYREPHTHTISNRTWRELSKSCPKLKVRFSIGGLSDAKEILNLLQTNAPVYSLFMTGNFRNVEKYFQLSAILNHLVTYFKDTLEDVKLLFAEMDYTPDNELVYFIERIHQLRSFQYLGKFGIGVPNAIYERLKDEQSVLQKVFISSITDDFDQEMERKINLIHVLLGR